MTITARHYLDSRWIELAIREGRIAEVGTIAGPEAIDPEDDWVAPAFCDIQINGRWGHSFCSPDLTVEQSLPATGTPLAETLFTGIRYIAQLPQFYPTATYLYPIAFASSGGPAFQPGWCAMAGDGCER